jgi:uncharacterized membrane protein YcfT
MGHTCSVHWLKLVHVTIDGSGIPCVPLFHVIANFCLCPVALSDFVKWIIIISNSQLFLLMKHMLRHVLEKNSQLGNKHKDYCTSFTFTN